MAENSPSDILTSDWNPIVGCQRYSPGCKSCWWFDGIMPWQQRLGNLPRNFQENQALILEKRFDPKILRAKRGIIGVLQHGDLFWTKVEDAVITAYWTWWTQMPAVARKSMAKIPNQRTKRSTSSGQSARNAWRSS